MGVELLIKMREICRSSIEYLRGLTACLLLLGAVAVLICQLERAYLLNASSLWLVHQLWQKDGDWLFLDGPEPPAFSLRDAGRSRNWLAKSTADDAPNVAAWRLLGMVYMAEQDWSAAESTFKQILQRDPTDQVTAYWLAITYVRQGRLQEATPLWSGIGAGRQLVGVADNLAAERRYEESVSWYDLAILVGERTSDKVLSGEILGLAYRGLGEVYRTQDLLPEAIANYERCVSYLPDRTDLRYLLARMYAQSGRYDEAIDHLKTSREIRPTSLSSCGALGEIYVETGQVSAAGQTLRQCLDLIETGVVQDDYWHGRVSFALSTVYGEKAQWGVSIDAAVTAMSLLGIDPLWTSELPTRFHDALEAEPERLDWYLKIGDAYLALEMFQEAASYYEMAAAMWPDDPRVVERIAVLNGMPDSEGKK